MARTSLALLLLCACRADATQLIVVVDSNIDTLTKVQIYVEPGDMPDMEPDREVDIGPEPFTPLPFSFGVAPRKGVDVEEQMPRLRAVGLEGNTVAVERRVQAGFVKRKSLYLLLYLAEECRGVVCDPGLTCDRGVCVPESIDPSTLPTVPPNQALFFDAGPPLTSDGGLDAMPTDSTVDVPSALAAPRIFFPWSGVAARNVEVLFRPAEDSAFTTIEFGTCEVASPACVPAPSTTQTLTRMTNSRLFGTDTDGVGRIFFRLQACRTPEDCGPWTETRYFDLGRSDSDTDGDGLDDIVAGAPGFGAGDEGEVWWYPNVPAPPVALGSRSETRFGERVAFVGDIDTDGTSDLVVASQDGVQIFHGRSADVPMPSGSLLDYAGIKDLAGLGDIDGDGFADFGACDGATTRIYYGPPLEFSVLPEPARRIAAVGDLDGDGLAEFAITEGENVIVYRGSTTREFAPLTVIDAPETNRGFGDMILSVGDQDRDQVPDLIIGAPDGADGVPEGGNGGGAVYFVSGDSLRGASPSMLLLDLAPRERQHLGTSAARLSDGYVVAGPGGPGMPDVDGELIHVIHAGSIMPTTLADDFMDDRLGAALASGDYSGDVSLQLVAGAPQGGMDSEGALAIYAGSPPSASDTREIPVRDGTAGASTSFGQSLAQAPPSRLR